MGIPPLNHVHTHHFDVLETALYACLKAHKLAVIAEAVKHVAFGLKKSPVSLVAALASVQGSVPSWNRLIPVVVGGCCFLALSHYSFLNFV